MTDTEFYEKLIKLKHESYMSYEKLGEIIKTSGNVIYNYIRRGVIPRKKETMEILLDLLNADGEMKNYFTNVIMKNSPKKQKITLKTVKTTEKQELGTLCWEYQRILKGLPLCSWTQNLTPVTGWEVEPTIVKNTVAVNRNHIYKASTTYRVKKCPLFVGE